MTPVARRSQLLSAAAVFTAGFLLVGCQNSGSYSQSDTDVRPVTASSTTEGPGASASASVGTPAPAAAPTVRATDNQLYYPTGERASSVLLLEKTGPAQVRVGQPYNYQIKVTNLTNAPLHGVTVQETLPGTFQVSNESANGAAANATGTTTTGGPGASAGIAVGSDATGGTGPGASVGAGVGNGTPSGAGTTATGTAATANGATANGATANAAANANASAGLAAHTYAVGELGPHESRTINVSGTASQPGTLASCMSVTYAPTLCTTALVTNPQLRLAKEVMGSGDLCELQTIRYTVTNDGTGDLNGVRVDDPLPDGLTTQDGSNRVSFNVGTVAQGQSRAFEVKVKPSRAGEFSSTATASADDGLTAKSQATAMAVHAPKLEITLKAPEKEYMGQPVNYEVTVKNIGDAPARNAMVRLDAAGETQTGAEAQTAAAREGGSQQLGALEPGQSRTVTLAYNPKSEGDLKVNASATDPCAGTATALGTTTITSIPALLLSAVDDHDPIRVGDNVTYTITVLNQGFGADKDVRVDVTLPDGEQYVSSTGASAGTAAGQKVTFAPVSNIAPKQTLTWTVTVKALKASDVRFRVDLHSASFPDAGTKIEPTRLY